MNFPEDFDPDDFDPPIADPAIRAEYQDALGRFIMAHNEVDFWLKGILTKAVKMLAPDGSLDSLAMGDFAARVAHLNLLMKTAPHIGFGNAGNGRLAELNSTRNILAHGYFDQDPYEGTYEIVRNRHRTLASERLTNHNAASINTQATELEEIASHMSAVFDFIDHPVPAEYLRDWPVSQKSAELWEMIQLEAGQKEQSGPS